MCKIEDWVEVLRKKTNKKKTHYKIVLQTSEMMDFSEYQTLKPTQSHKMLVRILIRKMLR